MGSARAETIRLRVDQIAQKYHYSTVNWSSHVLIFITIIPKAIQVLCFDIHHQQLSQTPAVSYLPACRLLNRVSSPEDHQSQPFHQNSWRDIFVEKFCGNLLLLLLLITKSVQYDFVESANIPTPRVT